MKNQVKHLLIALALCSTLNLQPSIAFAQGTAFTYQGQLVSGGAPANGSYDLTFTLFNTNSSGVALAGPVTNSATSVSNGLFTTTIDFVGGVFTGSNYWLELAVRTNGSGSFTTLSPRQPILPTPYAIFSANAGNAVTAATAATAGSATSATSATTAGSATTATTANNFSGPLSGDVTGTQGATLVSTVGGVTAANVASGANAANAATSVNTPNTIVLRDASGNFSAGSVTLNNSLYLPGPTATVYSGGNTLLRSDGNDNFFAGPGAGNSATSGFGNTANGYQAFQADTSGSANTANGYGALNSNTSGGNNTANGYQTLQYNTSGSFNTANGMNALIFNTSGSYNTANGAYALNGQNLTTGSYNIALGYQAGYNFTGNESSNIDIGNLGLTGDNNTIRIGTVGIHTNTFISGVINGNGGGLTNVNASVLGGTISLAQLPSAVVTNMETGVAFGNTTISDAIINGTLSLPAIIESGGQLLSYWDTNGNYFAGPDAGLTNENSFYEGSNNTVVGYQAFLSTNIGNFCTAIGYQADQSAGTACTAVGYQALSTGGAGNTAVGYQAIELGNLPDNTAVGYQALQINLLGTLNTAVGYQALEENSPFFSEIENTAIGFQALLNNDGLCNTAVGSGALVNNNGFNLFSPLFSSYNTAVGSGALANNTGSYNIALGYGAGDNITTNNNNIDIGNEGTNTDSGVIRIGTTNIQTTAFIAGIYGVTTAGGVDVKVDSSGKLGTTTSSARFKTDIHSMGDASGVLLSLHPVSFKYKPALDPQGIPQFGLVAEEVEKIDPDLVVRGQDGKPYTVRYDAVNAMLLNEFLKQHRMVEQQHTVLWGLNQKVDELKTKINGRDAEVASLQTKVADLQSQLDGLQKAVARLASKPASTFALNSPRQGEK